MLTVLSVLLVAFVLVEVNYPILRPQSQLAIFAALGIAISLMMEGRRQFWWVSVLMIAGFSLAAAWMVFQTEPVFSAWWSSGMSLGDRAGAETRLDLWLGGLGLIVVLEATRRRVGWALPILALVFLLYAFFGRHLPDLLMPHRGYDFERIVSQTFLQSQGVFGIALSVMFSYVFLFVFFGAVLEATGATQFIIDAARRIFRGSVGGAAKVAVLSSGLMGSLSGSAVANTATTGTFTIPLMRSSGFRAHIAAGVEAAASSGGALMPPVMGAGAYMMLEIVEPPVTYLEIIRAALIPAILYYLSLFFIVHLFARRIEERKIAEGAGGAGGGADDSTSPLDEEAWTERAGSGRWPGFLFASSLSALVVFLLIGFTVFRAVTIALVVLIVLAAFRTETRVGWRRLVSAAEQTCRAGVALICAAACVGILIGVVTLTGIGTKLPSLILPLAEESLVLALLLIMVSSILLGMGLPSAVCYLLMATLIGPVIGDLGIVPLSAHMFIFYFGMMSMVTPPVALAAFTAASIAKSGIMRSSMAAFRFALAGFTLPFMFVFRPELLLLSPDGELDWMRVFLSVVVAVVGLVPLAASIAGYLRGRLVLWLRLVLFAAAILLLWPGREPVGVPQLAGAVVVILVLLAPPRWFTPSAPTLKATAAS